MKPVLEHNGEVILLGIVAVIVGGLAGVAIAHGSADAGAAWSTVLMAIVAAIKERWQARTIDRMGQQLGTSTPAGDAATGKVDDPVHTREDGA